MTLPPRCVTFLAFCLVLGASACSRKKPAARRIDPAVAAVSPHAQLRPGPRPAPAPLPETGAAVLPPSSPRGGILRVHLDSEPPHLHPLEDDHPSIDRLVNGLVYQPLFECRASGPIPVLAESWDDGADAHRLLIKLRPGVQWHDDRALTVVDVQATLESVLRSTSKLPLLRASLADVAAVEIAAERTIRLRLHRPSRALITALCHIPILPEQSVRGGPSAAAALGRQPNGTGPFRFVAWEHGRRFRFARARASWQPPAPLDEIVFELETDAVRALARFRKGDIDILPRLIDAHYPDQVTPAALGDAATLHILSPHRRSFLAINHRHDIFADRRVRQALSLLWDRARLADEFHRGLARPTGAGPRATDPGFNPTEAARLLDDVGLRDSNADGVRDRGGIPLRLKLVFSTAARNAVQELKSFAHDLRRAGLLAELAPTEPAALMPRLRAGDFDLAPLVWESRPQEDPRAFLDDLSFTGFRMDHLAPAWDAWRLAPNENLRRQARTQLEALVDAELPVISLYAHDVPALAARRVLGLSTLGGDLDLRSVAVAP